MFRRASGLIVLALAMLAISAPARAQDYSIYVQATGASLRSPGANHVYGGTFGIMREKHDGIMTFGVDARGSLLYHGNVSGLYTDDRFDVGTIGFRVGVTPPGLHLTPYAEGALGLGYFRGGTGLTRQDKTGGYLEGRAGADYHLLPMIDWRVAEITYGRITGNSQIVNPITVSTGVVFHLP